MPILRRTPRQARPHLDERLDPCDLEDNNEPLVLRRQWPDLLPQPWEKKALNVIPAIG
jgi:hypothetical protein